LAKDGKSFFSAWPHDHPDAIMRQLLHTGSARHFNYSTPLGEPREEYDDAGVLLTGSTRPRGPTEARPVVLFAHATTTFRFFV